MCGLVGIFRPVGSRVDLDLLARMRDSLAHRGPDDACNAGVDTASGKAVLMPGDDGPGTFACNLGLGFRRLAIIDTSEAGRQPMASPDGNVWMVFNGEIYNYKELRRELAGRGVSFRSDSDTEVIIALYQAEGTRAFERLNGMFALALWDGRTGELHLVRDRLGIKPLYYAWAGEDLIFASEIKAILHDRRVSRELDAEAVAECFSFQAPVTRRALFRDINMLALGTRITVASSRRAEQSTFWTAQYKASTRPAASLARDLEGALEAALTRQIRSDVPLGFFLSGGIDTGLIGALATRTSPNRLDSFTCGFDVSGLSGDEALFDERPEARQLAATLGSRHHEIELAPSHFEDLIKSTIWHQEEPCAGISYQIYAIAEKVRGHVTVVLSGVGGDETFAGYPWRYRHAMGAETVQQFDQRYFEWWCRLIPAGGLESFIMPSRGRDLDAAVRRGFQDIMDGCNSADQLDRALYFDLRTFLHALLMVEDKLTMAHGLESRVPILDNEVLELALSIPSAMKFDGDVTKKILKAALKGVLPDEVLDRRKQGFTPPAGSWYRQHNWRFIEDTMLSEQFRARDWLQADSVRRILDQHRTGEHDHHHLIWSMMCFEWMHRALIDPDIPTNPAAN